MQAQAYTSDRTCFTQSSTGTTKITAWGEGCGLSARKKENSSLTSLLVDQYHCSPQFSDPRQTWLRPPQQDRLTAVPPAQGRGGCQALLVSRKRGALASWTCGSRERGSERGRHLSLLQCPCGDSQGRALCRAKLASQVLGVNKPCSANTIILHLLLSKGGGCLPEADSYYPVVLCPPDTPLSSCLTSLPRHLWASLCRKECGGGCFLVCRASRALVLHCSGCSIPASVGELSMGLLWWVSGTAQEGNRNTGQCKEEGLVPRFLLSRTSKQHSPCEKLEAL